MHDNHPHKLRELASWYREFAERAENPAIWDGRLRMAENLDAKAGRIERRRAAGPRRTGAASATNARHAELEGD
jgi:hypothetical protein